MTQLGLLRSAAKQDAAKGPKGNGVHVIFGPEFQRVVEALRELDKTFPGKLRKGMQDAVKPVVNKAKANMLAMPVKRGGGNDIRRKVARGIRVRAALGNASKDARIRIITTVPDADMAAIPRGMNSPKGWRHPVFGERSEWVVQHAARPGWFLDPMQLNREYVRDEIEKLVDEAAKKVADAGGEHH